MDPWSAEVEALEAELRAGGDERAVEEVLRRGELTAQRLDALAALADRLANRLRARVISDCLERLEVSFLREAGSSETVA
jgi:hypothetical protein